MPDDLFADDGAPTQQGCGCPADGATLGIDDSSLDRAQKVELAPGRYAWRTRAECEREGPQLPATPLKEPLLEAAGKRHCQWLQGQQPEQPICTEPACPALYARVIEEPIECMCTPARVDDKETEYFEYFCLHQVKCCCGTRGDTSLAAGDPEPGPKLDEEPPPTPSSECEYIDGVFGGWTCYRGAWSAITIHRWQCPEGQVVRVQVHEVTKRSCEEGGPLDEIEPVTTDESE